MKIVYYEGNLISFIRRANKKKWFYRLSSGKNIQISSPVYESINAGGGFLNCITRFKTVQKLNKQADFILTNLVELMDAEYSWNNNDKKFEVYFVKEQFGKIILVDIQDCTVKELRKEHFVSRLYKAGAFENPNNVKRQMRKIIKKVEKNS